MFSDVPLYAALIFGGVGQRTNLGFAVAGNQNGTGDVMTRREMANLAAFGWLPPIGGAKLLPRIRLASHVYGENAANSC